MFSTVVVGSSCCRIIAFDDGFVSLNSHLFENISSKSSRFKSITVGVAETAVDDEDADEVNVVNGLLN